jgi:hypothetical protein
MILKYGPCEIHRKSFLKKIYKNANNWEKTSRWYWRESI